MPRKFVRNNGTEVTVLTAEESFDRGFEIGKDWNAPFHPRGILASMALAMSPKEASYQAYLDACNENRFEWLRGFKAGQLQQQMNKAGE